MRPRTLLVLWAALYLPTLMVAHEYAHVLSHGGGEVEVGLSHWRDGFAYHAFEGPSHHAEDHVWLRPLSAYLAVLPWALWFVKVTSFKSSRTHEPVNPNRHDPSQDTF